MDDHLHNTVANQDFILGILRPVGGDRGPFTPPTTPASKGRLTVAGAVFRQRVTQDALRAGPDDGVAGLSRPRRAGEERVRRVRVEGLRLALVVRRVLLVVQAPGQTQVAPVLVDAAHVPPAGVRQETTLIHIWNTERSAEGPRSLRRRQKTFLPSDGTHRRTAGPGGRTQNLPCRSEESEQLK